MRICLLSERLAPPFDEGFKIVALNLGDEWAALPGHQLLRLTCFGEDVAAHDIRNVAANRLFLSWPLARAIREFAPEVLFYLPTAAATLPSLLRSALLRSYARPGRLALIILQPRRYSARARRLWELAARWLSPDLLLASSSGALRATPPLSCPQARIPLGVDLQRFVPGAPERKLELRRKYGLDEKAWVLLHVGHIKRERNVQLLKRVQSPDCQVVLVGSTSTRAEQDLAAELTAAGVRVISHYLPIVEAYQLADGYLFPAQDEIAAIGVPLSVLEALACNLPVVATPFGGLPEWLPARPDAGLWYAQSDDQLVAAVEGMRAAAAIATRALVAGYGWPAVAGVILNVTLHTLGLL